MAEYFVIYDIVIVAVKAGDAPGKMTAVLTIWSLFSPLKFLGNLKTFDFQCSL